MSSKNNPDNRGRVTAARQHQGKPVKPVLYIDGNTRYMAAMYEDGNLVMANGSAVPYKSI